MSSPDSIGPATTRVMLARLAEQAIAAEDAVSATQGGGRWLTRDGDRSISGVVVGQTVTGAVDLELHLIADFPPSPLQQLTELLRAAIVSATIRTGLTDRLGKIDVTIHDLRDPDEGEGGQ